MTSTTTLKVQPMTGEHDDHLFEPFTVRDLSVEPFAIDRRDEVRVPALLDDLAQRCSGEHVNHAHPFCPGCRRDDPTRVAYAIERGVPALEIKQQAAKAEMSLRRWLALNPGRSLPEVDDRWAPEGKEDVTTKPYVGLADLDDFPEPEWLVPSVIPTHSVGYLSGFDGTFKTFAALNFSLHLARTGRRVLYVMGEGVHATGQRVAAWLEHNGVDRPEVEQGIDIRTSTVDLFAGGPDFEEMVQRAEARNYDLVVVDTLARSVGGGNQDSASDMSVVTQRLDRLKRACGGTVLVVAHTGKDADRGIRGSSALRANADFAITMKRGDDDTVRISTKVEHGGKQKDGTTDFEMLLAAHPVGDSIVLIDAAQRPEAKVLESSHSNRNRVLVAFGQQASLGYVSQAQVRAVIAEDGTHKGAMNPGTVSALVADLVREGLLQQDGTKKQYRLNPDNESARRYLEENQ